MAEINLLPEEERKQVETKKVKQKVRKYSSLALIATIIVSVFVFAFWVVLVQQDRQLTTKIDDLSSQIKNLSNVESLARVLKNKLSSIVSISAKSQNFEDLLNNVSQIIPAGVTLSDLTVSDQGLITLTGTAVSASEFSSLVTTLSHQDASRANFTTVTVESLTRDDKGIYKFAISAKLKGSTITQVGQGR